MTLMEKEIFEQGRALQDCLKYNEGALDSLAEEIIRKKISFALLAARGSSDNAGTYFKYALESLTGIPLSLAAPSVSTLYGGNLTLKDCFAIGVSQSGAAEDVMAVLGGAKEQGALIASITNNTESKMAKTCGIHLYCAAGEEKSVAATKTFTTEMYLLAQLAARVAQNKPLIQNLNALPNGVEEVFKLKGAIERVAEKYKSVQSFIVLARGLSYAVAQETSLKLQETCYVNARPYAVSDFAHGPFALVDQNTNIILIAPSGESANDMLAMKERLIASGANILMYTDKPEYAEGCADSIIIPAGGDYITPFYSVIVSQLFACALSQKRGLNPDAPRGLKKVTVTK